MIVKVKTDTNKTGAWKMPFLLLAFIVGHLNKSSHELSGLVIATMWAVAIMTFSAPLASNSSTVIL